MLWQLYHGHNILYYVTFPGLFTVQHYLKKYSTVVVLKACISFLNANIITKTCFTLDSLEYNKMCLVDSQLVYRLRFTG